jgi:hypothetical protein
MNQGSPLSSGGRRRLGRDSAAADQPETHSINLSIVIGRSRTRLPVA